MKGVAVPGFKIDKNGKVVRDHAAADAKLDLCARLRKKNSKKVRVTRKGQS